MIETPPVVEDFAARPFKRVNQHAWVKGVCGGIAYFLGVPTWAIRVLTIVSIGVGGVFLYLMVAFMAPEWDPDPKDYEDICE